MRTVGHLDTEASEGGSEVSEDQQCMARRCDQVGEYEIRAIDPSLAAHKFPVILCRQCLGTESGIVDFFRWADGKAMAW